MDNENEKKLYALGFTKTTDNDEKVGFQRQRCKSIEMIHFIKKGHLILRDTILDAAEDHEISQIVEALEKEYFKD